MILKLSVGEGNGIEFSLLVDLGEKHAKPAGFVGCASGSVSDQGILTVCPKENHDGF